MNVGGVWDGRGVTAEKLRNWRGVKVVAGPSGVAITTRLQTSDTDEVVLDAIAEHLGRLRRQRLNTRKTALTAQSSARWANAIIGANNDQYRLSREAQYRHLVGLLAAIITIEKRLAAPTGDTLSAQDRKACKGRVKGYPTQAERCEKLRRVQHLRSRLCPTLDPYAVHRRRAEARSLVSPLHRRSQSPCYCAVPA